MNYKIDLSEVERIVKNFPGSEQAAAEEIRTGMHQSTSVLHEQIAGRTSVFNGTARDSLTQRVYGTDAHLFGEVVMTAMHGAVLEFGRKPGSFPPVDAIEYWVIRKLGITEDSRSIAYLIARKIARSGTEGAHMFEKGLAAAWRHLDRIWKSTGARLAQRIERSLTK